jgi:hypothetical protein
MISLSDLGITDNGHCNSQSTEKQQVDQILIQKNKKATAIDGFVFSALNIVR